MKRLIRIHGKKLPWSWLLAICVTYAIWLALAVPYVGATRSQTQNDIEGHIDYVKTIALTHEFPGPYEGWQTYHPPAFHYLASKVSPIPLSANTTDTHVRRVRLLEAILLGGVFVIAILYLLSRFKVSLYLSMLIGSYIVSLPAAVLHFTSYNNDALATSMVLVAGCASLEYLSQKKKLGQTLSLAILFLAGVVAVYTKYTALFAFAGFGLVLLGAAIFKQVTWRKGIVLGSVIFVVLLSVTPWLVFHNRAMTGKLFPHNVESLDRMEFARMDTHGGKAAFFLNLPGTSTGEWNTPWGSNEEGWAKNNFWSSDFVTSVFNEWDYGSTRTLPLSDVHVAVKLGWYILWIQVLLVGWALVSSWRKLWVPLALIGTALAGQIYHLIYVQSFVNAANFRYVFWIMPLVAVILGVPLSRFAVYQKKYCAVFASLLFIGVMLHVWFIQLMHSVL